MSMETNTLDITPVTARLQKDLRYCRVEIYQRDEETGAMEWRNFAAEEGYFPVAACLELFMGWGWVSNPVRIVTESGRLVCANEAYYTKLR